MATITARAVAYGALGAITAGDAPVRLLGAHPSHTSLETLVLWWEVARIAALLVLLVAAWLNRRELGQMALRAGRALRANGARWYRTAAILLLNTAVLFAALNGCAVAYRHAADATWTPGFIEKYGRETARAIYPGLSDEQINGILRETWHRGDRYGSALSGIKEVPFAGAYVNATRFGYRQNARPLPWPPAADQPTVFVFGGSTTWGYGLPDWQTIPAQIAEIATDRAVYNFGRASFKLANERVLFEVLLLLGHRPDTAVFIDGLNDLWPYPDDAAAIIRAEFIDPANRPRLVLEAVPVVRELLSWQARRRNAWHDPDPSIYQRPEWAAERIAAYLENKASVERTCAAYGIRCLFFWQPIPDYKFDRSDYPFGVAGEFGRARGRAYEYAAQALPQAPGAPIHWLADLQDGRTGPFYVDGVHYNARLAGMIAAAIAEVLP